MDPELMSSSPLVEAITLAVRSDVMLFAAMTIIGSTYLLGRISRNRALTPGIKWRQALSGPKPPKDSSRTKAGTASTLITVALLGLVGASILSLTDHPPSPLLVLVPAIGAATIAVVVAARIVSKPGPRSFLSGRGVRLLASSLFEEVSAALAVVITVAVVLHTEGLTAISVVEVVAIALATRLAVRRSPWPGGLGLADVTLLIPLTWIGVPIHVALSAILIWRVSSLLAVTAALILTRGSLSTSRNSIGQHSTDLGRVFHRALFMTISLLPATVRDSVRRKVFNRLFALSQDPWDYQTSAYEARKREHLLAAIPPNIHGLAEVGCAEGHNLVALARMRPEMMLFGLDISEAAIAIATKRAEGLGNIHLLSPGDPDNFAMLRTEGIDCVVLSEVLYYMGHQQGMRKNFAQLREVMLPDCYVVMLHGASDAQVLHQRAMRALNLRVVSETRVDDPIRPFVLTVSQIKSAEPTHPHQDLSYSWI